MTSKSRLDQHRTFANHGESSGLGNLPEFAPSHPIGKMAASVNLSTDDKAAVNKDDPNRSIDVEFSSIGFGQLNQ